MTAETPPPSPRRRPKGDKRARTRAWLIEVAALLVEEKGYEGATLQEVARRAGMSNGAVYGNFKNREDLFAQIGPTYWPQVSVDIAPGATLAELMAAWAEGLLAVMPVRARRGAGRLKGLAYALGNPGLRERAVTRAETLYAGAADWLTRTLADPQALPMPPVTFARVLGSLTEGLTLQRLLTPELISDETIRSAFAALAGEAPPRDR